MGGSLALTTRRSVQRMKLAVVVPHQQLPSPAHPSSSCLELFSVLSSSTCSEAQLQQESMQACCNISEHGQHFAPLLYSQSLPNCSSRQESFNYNCCRMSFSQN